MAGFLDKTGLSYLWQKIVKLVSQKNMDFDEGDSYDLDDYISPGVYYFKDSGSSIINAPNGAVNGWLIVLNTLDNDVKQIWHGDGVQGEYKDFYIRLFSNASWQNWTKVITDAQASSSTPKALGTASAGTSLNYSRYDHVHPKPSAADIGAIPGITIVTTTSTTNLNNYSTPGVYFFTSNNSEPIANAPNSSVTGWLFVIKSNGSVVKQIWHRSGSANSTVKDYYFREYTSSTGWISWIKVITDQDATTVTPKALAKPGAGVVGTSTAYARADHVHPGTTASPTVTWKSITGITISDKYCKEKNGIVFLECTVSVEASVNNEARVIATLPSGYRPSVAIRARFPGRSKAGATNGIFNTSIDTSGNVYMARDPSSVYDGSRLFFVFPTA